MIKKFNEIVCAGCREKIKVHLKEEVEEKRLGKGQKAYEKYYDAVDGVSDNGDQMSRFESLPANIKKAWVKSAN